MNRSRQATATREPVLHDLQTALKGSSRRQSVQSFVRILRDNFSSYSWVGVYLGRGDHLVLEAYAGGAETEHVSIPIGQGICGAAARTGETIVVPDVSQDPRYLMCFPSTRSEIVVPVTGRKGVLGEIDIDSDKLAAFSPQDKEFLEEAARLLATYLEKD